MKKLKQTLENVGKSDINADSEKKIAEINAAIKEYQNNNYYQYQKVRKHDTHPLLYCLS